MENSYIDFVIVNEPWNEYQLEDGTILKFRVILKRIRKEKKSEKQSNYIIDSHNLLVILKVPSHLMGEPDDTPKKIEKKNFVKDVNFSVKQEDWNDYMLSDGTRLRIKASVVTVYRTDLYDKNGEPIYHVESTIQTMIKLPEK
ncbi:MAG: hypothetical protein ACTSP3_02605 [Candidatus Heimdallarchaeaceae archaeon]